MVTIELDKTINKLVILTDDPTLHYFLESKQSEYRYLPWKKQWGYVEKTVKIYETGKHTLGNGLFKYVVGKGWTGYLLGIFKEKLSADNYTRLVLEVLKADSYRTEDFPELRDYQNQDVLYLLQHRFGLMCVNTGYGGELPSYVEIYN